jgi:hypothetical protein
MAGTVAEAGASQETTAILEPVDILIRQNQDAAFDWKLIFLSEKFQRIAWLFSNSNSPRERFQAWSCL